MTVTVKGKSGNPYPDLPVYAFTVTPADPATGATEPVVTYSGYNGKTDAEGKVVLTLPAGDYRFRSDYDGVQFWSDTEKACSVLALTTAETPGCQTAEVVLPGGTGKINVTIDYEYDVLNRITSATYTDAENIGAAATRFTYSYDAAGNVEEYVSVISGQTVTTTYRYNAANELVSATRNNVVWVYEYDGNGALLSTQPESGLASGSKKYSYNTAGYLTKVEGYTGSAWYTQAEMYYTGLGERLSMTGSTEDGQSVSTTYALSNGTVLLANASGKVTAYLYGNGAIGEQTDAWSYALIDGTGTPRQMVDQSAKVTAIASYTPWGDVLQSGGTGSFATGYLGGMMDSATGLIYVGNGQYYDRLTGRFLTRGANASQTNPYVPWKGDPAGAVVGPLILLSALFEKKKNKNKWLTGIHIVLIIGLSIMILTACGLPAPAGNSTPIHTLEVVTDPKTGEIVVYDGETEVARYPIVTSTPLPKITLDTSLCTNTPTATPSPSATPTATQSVSDDKFRITLADLSDKDMLTYLKTEDQTMLMARLAIGEATEGDMASTREEKSSIMWIVRVRSEVGYSKYLAGDKRYMNTLSKTSIKKEILADGQFDAITQLINNPAWVMYDTSRENYKYTNVVRMGNPYSDDDLRRLKEAYTLAQEILGQRISDMPDLIKNYDSYLGTEGSSSIASSCMTLESPRDYLRSSLLIGQSAFYDCAYVDNYHLFKDFSKNNNYLPPEE